jgi:hypothetical protein
MMERRIHISNVDDSPAVCFDTGLDPRSFARTKMSQSLTEPGYIVYPDGTHKEWKTAGVFEKDGFMRVWGPLHSAKRLDLLLDEIDSGANNVLQDQQTALRAIISWIKAKMYLGDTFSAANPGAAFINKNSVFITPEHLSSRCLFLERTEFEGMGVEATNRDRYNCPYLSAMESTAFCAAAMLYKTLTKTHPYPSKDIYQDMLEGIFLPVHLAAPDLNDELSNLIQTSLLLPVKKKQEPASGIDILTKMLKLLQELLNASENMDISALFTPVTEEKKVQTEKEKKAFLLRQNSVTGTKRFVTRNKPLLLGISIGLLAVLFITFSILRTISQRPTTEGLSPEEVVYAYYDAFSRLDHMFMEACIHGADKSDINAATTMFAMTRIGQAYAFGAAQIFFTASEWLEMGGELPSTNAFGVTDLTVEHITGSEFENMVIFRADYKLWLMDGERPIIRYDILTLRQDRRMNWRITEIQRTER